MKLLARTRRIVYAICAIHVASVIYLIFALPSIPTLFADAAWVAPQVAEHKDRGDLDPFLTAMLRANSIAQQTATKHLIACVGLSLLTVALGGYALLRTKEDRGSQKDSRGQTEDSPIIPT